MKNNLLFIIKSCPHCRRALAWMDELKQENPTYAEAVFTIIDEINEPDIADSYDYFLVPACYVDGEKVHEGIPTKEKIRNVLEKACKKD